MCRVQYVSAHSFMPKGFVDQASGQYMNATIWRHYAALPYGRCMYRYSYLHVLGEMVGIALLLWEPLQTNGLSVGAHKREMAELLAR